MDKYLIYARKYTDKKTFCFQMVEAAGIEPASEDIAT